MHTHIVTYTLIFKVTNFCSSERQALDLAEKARRMGAASVNIEKI